MKIKHINIHILFSIKMSSIVITLIGYILASIWYLTKDLVTCTDHHLCYNVSTVCDALDVCWFKMLLQISIASHAIIINMFYVF